MWSHTSKVYTVAGSVTVMMIFSLTCPMFAHDSGFVVDAIDIKTKQPLVHTNSYSRSRFSFGVSLGPQVYLSI